MSLNAIQNLECHILEYCIEACVACLCAYLQKAVFINVGRANVVKDATIIHALK